MAKAAKGGNGRADHRARRDEGGPATAISGRVSAPQLSEIITDPRISRIAGSPGARGARRAVRGPAGAADLGPERQGQKSPQLRQGMDQGGLQQARGRPLRRHLRQRNARLAGPVAQRVGSKQADQFYALGSPPHRGRPAELRRHRRRQPKAGESTYGMVLQGGRATAGARTAARSGFALRKSLAAAGVGGRRRNQSSTTWASRRRATADLGAFSVSAFRHELRAAIASGSKSLLFGSREPLRKGLDEPGEGGDGAQKGIEKRG
jgi:hypothetical protein